MATSVDPTEKERSLKYSVRDGAAFSVMTGFGEQYFSPLAIELGASNMQVGLLASIPQFVSSLLQLYTSKFTVYFKGRKRLITNFVLLQALTWIPLALVPLLVFYDRVSILLLLVVVYFVFGQFVGPVWSSLMGDLVDENTRGRFFGRRNMIAGAVAFASIFAAGIFLSLFPKNMVLYGFTCIFCVAFIARIFSWYYLSKTVDPHVVHSKTDEFSFIGYLKKLKETNYGRFALYLGVMNFSVNIAGPFFTVYMLRDLQLNYFDYTLLTASVALTSFLAMTYWGGIADRFGNKRVLNVCGILVAIVPLLWLFSNNLWYLVFAQAVSGFAWSGFNLSAANFIFDNVRPTKRTRVFSYHNVLAGTAVFIGALVGGVLAQFITFKWVFFSSLQIIFLISGVFRGIASFYFLPRIQEVRCVECISTKDLFLRYSGTGPILGMTFKAVTGLQRSIKHARGGNANGRLVVNLKPSTGKPDNKVK